MSDYDIGAAFEAIEDEITASMMRNLSRHRAEETAAGINWLQWQVEQLKALEDFKVRNAKKYPEQFRDINDRIPSIINAQRKSGQADQEVAILEAIKQGHKPPAAKMKTTKQAKLDAQFFTTNDRKMNALIKATTDDMEKAETSILRRANDQYRKIIYNAQVYANSGAGTYAKAVDMATKDFLSAGINSIEYKNGSRHTVSDYADMAIRTASKRAYLTGEGEKRKEMGEHLVIMNKRGAPCPKCLPFVGKIMIDDVWSGGCRDDGNYPLMSSAIDAGLYHPRCQDSHSTYFAGITKVDEAYTQKELNDIEEENKQEAREQYVIRQEKKYERLAKYSLDEENTARYEAKKEEWKEAAKNANIVKRRKPKNIENTPETGIIGLSRNDLDALLRYKSFESYTINDALRDISDVSELSPEQQIFVTNLDNALKKVKTYKGNLVRTVNFLAWSDCEERTQNFLARFKEEDTVKIKEYWSTSKSKEYDSSANIKIYIQNSQKGKDISLIGLDENEILYERNSIFKVLSKILIGDMWYILLEEV